MRTVGIIGGLGPESTAKFYQDVIFSVFSHNKETRPPVLLWSVPIPYQIEENFFASSEGEEQFIPYLVDASKRLEQAGVDFIVIPCNSVHIFIEQVRNAIHIPVLNVVEETVQFLKEKQIYDVGILATTATIRKKLYELKLMENGINIHNPSDEDQSRMGEIINHMVYSQHNQGDKREIMEIIDAYVKNEVKTILLASTDLQIMIPILDDVKIYDTMKILSDATVREILK